MGSNKLIVSEKFMVIELCLGKHKKNQVNELIAYFIKVKKSRTSKPQTKPSSSVQFSLSVMSEVLQHHGVQHFRLPCSSPTP